MTSRRAFSAQRRLTPARAALRGAVTASLVAGACVWATPAHADTLVIKRPGVHPNYGFEVEPHLLVGLIDPPGFGHGNGVGVGFRGTFEVVDNGFVSSINNSIGVGFGVDWVHYGQGQGQCVERSTARDCLAWEDEVSVDNFWFPVVMQWNFWLSRNWSVFGEPGVALRYESNEAREDDLHVEYLQFFFGGRYHFMDNLTLTMRVGYPTFSVGVSFLL